MSNKFLKALGIIGMVIAGVFSCFFGLTVMFTWDSKDAKDYYDTEQCTDYMYTEIYRLVNAFNEVYRNTDVYEDDTISYYVSNNTNVIVEEYDIESVKWNTIIDVDRDFDEIGKKITVYAVKDNLNNVYVTDKSTFDETKTTDGGYRITLSLARPITPDTTYYTSYVLYNITKPYSDSAVVLTVISLLSLLLLAFYEVSAAGHVKNEEGIHLTWWDKIPFDIMTIITIIICCLIGVMEMWSIQTFVQNAYGADFVEMFIVPMVVCIAFVSMIFIWILSLAVRIKSHTLLKNNALTGMISWLFSKIKKAVLTLKEYYRGSSRVWRIVIIFSIIAFIILTIMLLSFTSYYDGILYLFVFCLLILEVIGLAAFIQLSYVTRPILNQAQELSDGNLQCRIPQNTIDHMRGPFRAHAQNLNRISEGMEKAIQNELRSERMKAELITNVSHDIKTPLTSIINYVDLLSKEHTEEEEKQYLEILQRQSQRLKNLTEDVVEASKASAGTLQVHFETVSVKELLDQALAEYQDKFDANQLQVITTIMEGSMKVNADGRLLWRVYRNLLSNISKYALEGSRVYIDVRKRGDGKVVTTFKNISRDQLNISEEELMERFVRGDSSRHTEGSGLGLSIARSLTELMHGTFNINIDADLFKAEVVLEGIHEEA